MKKLALIACCLALIVCVAPKAMAVNSLLVESRSFAASQTACTLGVWLDRKSVV